MNSSTALFKAKRIKSSIIDEQLLIFRAGHNPNPGSLKKKREVLKRYIAKYDLPTRLFSGILFERDIDWISKEKILLGHKLGVQ